MTVTPPDPNEAILDFLTQWQASGGGMAADPNDPPVYWGARGRTTKRGTRDRQKVDGEFYVEKGEQTKRLSEAQLDFYNWTDAQRKEWGEYISGLGLISPDDAGDYTTLLQAWKLVTEEAAGFTAAGKKLTPRDVARLMAEVGGSVSSKKDGPFTGTKTATSQSVDLTDPKTAKYLVNRVLSEALGRDANDDELRALRETLNAAERSSPANTTTTSTFEEGDVVATSSTTSGGLTDAGRSEILREQAMQKPEYGSYQAARMVMGWLGQAISSPV